MKKPEILAPTGTIESVTAALNGGCDAIYIGGKAFNARQYASNPSDNELKDIINICHLRGVKVFITLNILYKEKEIADVLNFVKKVYEFGADGLIIQDIGMLCIVKKHFPDIKVSASTQMTVHNAEGVKFLSDIGVDRVVLARELGLDEIKDINKIKGNTETEVFVHGALCVCYSGRCLMSSLIGQRSGNRGRCAQPCRMDYTLVKGDKKIKKGCIISPKDIATLDILDKITKTGADSLKIEGRMKSPEYVYEVVSLYRKYIDRLFETGRLNTDKTDIKELTQIFNRGGSSSKGYYDSFSGASMISSSPKHSGVEIGKVIDYNAKRGLCKIELYDAVNCGDGIEIWSEQHTGTGINAKAEKGSIITVSIKGRIKKGDRVFKSFDKALNDRLKKSCQRLTRKMKVRARAEIGLDKSLIEFIDYGVSIEDTGAEKAQNQPMTRESIISRLSKTGDTPFELDFTDCNIDENIYMPVSQLNALRRRACDELERYIIEKGERTAADFVYKTSLREKGVKPFVSARVRTEEQLSACIKAGVKRIYCEHYIDTEEALKKCSEKGIEIYIALPFITRQGNKPFFEKYKKCDGYLVRSLGDMNSDKPIALDYSLNIMNRLSSEAMRELTGCKSITLSPELNMSELRETADKDSEIVVYGRLPLMTTHQCPVGLYAAEKGNKKYCRLKDSKDSYSLIDRTGRELPVIRDCSECTAFILNSSPVYVLNKAEELINTGAGIMRMEFTIEDYDTTLKLAKEHIKVIEKGHSPSLVSEDTTGGHFNRGVY